MDVVDAEVSDLETNSVADDTAELDTQELDNSSIDLDLPNNEEDISLDAQTDNDLNSLDSETLENDQTLELTDGDLTEDVVLDTPDRFDVETAIDTEQSLDNETIDSEPSSNAEDLMGDDIAAETTLDAGDGVDLTPETDITEDVALNTENTELGIQEPEVSEIEVDVLGEAPVLNDSIEIDSEVLESINTEPALDVDIETSLDIAAESSEVVIEVSENEVSIEAVNHEVTATDNETIELTQEEPGNIENVQENAEIPVHTPTDAELDAPEILETAPDVTETTIDGVNIEETKPDITNLANEVFDTDTPDAAAVESPNADPTSDDISQDVGLIKPDSTVNLDSEVSDIQEINFENNESSLSVDSENKQPVIEVSEVTAENTSPTAEDVNIKEAAPDIINADNATQQPSAEPTIVDEGNGLPVIDKTTDASNPASSDAIGEDLAEVNNTTEPITTHDTPPDFVETQTSGPEIITTESKTVSENTPQPVQDTGVDSNLTVASDVPIQTNPEITPDKSTSKIVIESSSETETRVEPTNVSPVIDTRPNEVIVDTPSVELQDSVQLQQSSSDTYQTPEVETGESLLEAPVVQETQFNNDDQQASTHEHGSGCQCSACNPFNKAAGAEQANAKFESGITIDIPESTVQRSEQQAETIQDNNQSANQQTPEVQIGELLLEASIMQDIQANNNDQQANAHEHGAGCQCSACSPFNIAAEKKVEFNPETKIDLGFDVAPSNPDALQQQTQSVTQTETPPTFKASNKDNWTLNDFAEDAQQKRLQENGQQQDTPKGGPCSDCFTQACATCAVAGNAAPKPNIKTGRSLDL